MQNTCPECCRRVCVRVFGVRENFSIYLCYSFCCTPDRPTPLLVRAGRESQRVLYSWLADWLAVRFSGLCGVSVV